MQISSLSKGSKVVNPMKTFFEEKTKEKYNTFHDFLIANENLMNILKYLFITRNYSHNLF